MKAPALAIALLIAATGAAQARCVVLPPSPDAPYSTDTARTICQQNDLSDRTRQLDFKNRIDLDNRAAIIMLQQQQKMRSIDLPSPIF